MNDPVKEWQRLNKLYGEMGDQELKELAGSFNDLTEFAQNALRDELQRRKLGTPESFLNAALGPKEAERGDEDSETEMPWILREDVGPQALATMRATLERAGIKSSIVNPTDNVYRTRCLQLQVAPVDAEKAEEVLAQPAADGLHLPDKEEMIDWLPPSCPKCGAQDALLIAVEPFNTWECDECGERWNEPADPTG